MNAKNIKNLVLLALICAQSVSLYGMKRPRGEEVPTLKELAQEAAERKMKKGIQREYMNIQAQVEQELAQVPEKFRIQLVKNHFDSLGTMEDLKNDPKMSMYLELVPEFKVSYSDLSAKFGKEFTQYIFTKKDHKRHFSEVIIDNIEDFSLLVDLLDFTTLLENFMLLGNRKLEVLRITGNITEELLVKLFQALSGSRYNINTLQIWNTNLQFIPDEIVLLNAGKTDVPLYTGFNVLSIDNNPLLQVLPDAIGALDNLETLRISRNPLLTEVSDLVIPENLKFLEIEESERALFSERIRSYFYKETRPYGNTPNLIQIMLVRENEPLSYQTFYDRFYPATFNEHVTFTQGQYPYTYGTTVGGKSSDTGYKLDIRNLADIVGNPVRFDEVSGVRGRAGVFERVMGAGVLEIVDLTVSGNILTEQLKSLFERNKNLWFVNISNSPIEFLPEELGNLENLKELTIVDCPNLQELPDSFENLLYQGVPEGIYFDEHVYSLIPERLKQYMPFERQNGLLKITPISPLTGVQERITEDELEAIRRAVDEDFSQLNRKEILDIIQAYAQSVFDNAEVVDGGSSGNMIKRTKSLGDDLLWQVYFEKLVEINGMIEVMVPFVIDVNDYFNENEVAIKLFFIENFESKNKKQLSDIFRVNKKDSDFDIFSYIHFYFGIDKKKFQSDVINLAFEGSADSEDFTTEMLSYYIDLIDDDIAVRVRNIRIGDGIGIIGDFPENLTKFVNVESLQLIEFYFPDDKLSESIARALPGIKKIVWFAPLNFQPDGNPISDFVFDMPNLKIIEISEEMFSFLSDEFKNKLLRIEESEGIYKLILKD